METGLGLYLARPLGVAFGDRMKMIRAAGFDSTALWWGEDGERARELRAVVPDIVRNAGVLIDNIHVSYRGCNDLWSAHDGDRDAAVERHVGWVRDCAQHDVSILVMHATMGTTPPPVNALGLESFQRIVDAAEEAGVVIAVENTRSDAHLSALLEAIPSAHLGLCFDSAHDFLYAPSPTSLLAAHGARLVATHFSDTDGRRDYHWLPGEGRIDFQAVTDMFPESYGGTYMLEVVPKDRSQPLDVFLSEAYDAAVGLLNTSAAIEGKLR